MIFITSSEERLLLSLNDLHHIFWGAFITFTEWSSSHLLRSVYYFHWMIFITSSEERLLLSLNDLHHIFWGAFITFTEWSSSHLLRSVYYFQLNDLHHIFWGAFITFTEWSSSHLLRSVYYFHWMIFITSSEERLLLHLSISIALYVWINILLRDITGDIERWLIFRSFYVSICCILLYTSHWFTLKAP